MAASAVNSGYCKCPSITKKPFCKEKQMKARRIVVLTLVLVLAGMTAAVAGAARHRPGAG